jgi:hypothetical protein
MAKQASYLHQKYVKLGHYETLYMKHLRTSTDSVKPQKMDGSSYNKLEGYL